MSPMLFVILIANVCWKRSYIYKEKEKKRERKKKGGEISLIDNMPKKRSLEKVKI